MTQGNYSVYCNSLIEEKWDNFSASPKQVPMGLQQISMRNIISLSIHHLLLRKRKELITE